MTLSARLKSSFVAGLILVTPLVVTLYVLSLLVTWSLRVVDPVVDGTRLAEVLGDVAAAQIVAAVAILVAITLLGYLAQRNVGRQILGNVGRVVNVIPLVSTVYGSVRQVANSLVDRDSAYDRAVLVEYPREGVYAVGLVTGRCPDPVREEVGAAAYNVFLPNSPNPTGGRLVLVPETEIHEIDMSVREGLRLTVTTGVGAEAADDRVPSQIPPAAEDADTAD